MFTTRTRTPCRDTRDDPVCRPQDRDWAPLAVGDPLFETLDGDVIAYAGEFGDRAVPIFVNEGGYYGASSGRGIGFAIERTVDVPADDGGGGGAL